MTDAAPPAPSRRRRFTHLARQVTVLAILVPVLVGVYLYFDAAEHAPAPREVQPPQAALPVGVIRVEARDVPLESQYLGQTEASQIVPIRARVSGYLVELGFDEGQQVEKDQVLFRIDPRPFEVALAQAHAQLAASEARLQRAAQQLNRIQSLVDRQAASAGELEEWQEEQSVAAAEVKLQQARIAQAQLDINYTTIRTPITGVIGESLQDVGSYISPTGDSLLATVRQVEPIFVRFSVSEQDLLRWQRLVSEGAVTDLQLEQWEVKVLLSDGRVYPHRGRINYVDVAVDPSTGTAMVRVTVPNPDGDLRPGQFVTVVVMGASRLDAILVPQLAVMQTPTGTQVYVVDPQGLAQIRPVTPGEWYGDQWIIESGLQPGDRVIVDHLMHVRPGQPVEATAIDATPAVVSTQTVSTR